MTALYTEHDAHVHTTVRALHFALSCARDELLATPGDLDWKLALINACRDKLSLAYASQGSDIEFLPTLADAVSYPLWLFSTTLLPQSLHLDVAAELERTEPETLKASILAHADELYGEPFEDSVCDVCSYDGNGSWSFTDTDPDGFSL